LSLPRGRLCPTDRHDRVHRRDCRRPPPTQRGCADRPAAGHPAHLCRLRCDRQCGLQQPAPERGTPRLAAVAPGPAPTGEAGKAAGGALMIWPMCSRSQRLTFAAASKGPPLPQTTVVEIAGSPPRVKGCAAAGSTGRRQKAAIRGELITPRKLPQSGRWLRRGRRAQEGG